MLQTPSTIILSVHRIIPGISSRRIKKTLISVLISRFKIYRLHSIKTGLSRQPAYYAFLQFVRQPKYSGIICSIQTANLDSSSEINLFSSAIPTGLIETSEGQQFIAEFSLPLAFLHLLARSEKAYTPSRVTQGVKIVSVAWLKQASIYILAAGIQKDGLEMDCCFNDIDKGNNFIVYGRKQW